MGIPSRTIRDRLQNRPAFQSAVATASQGQFIPVPGGVLILDRDGRAIGAVGISGDTSDRDEFCAIEDVKAAGLGCDPPEPAPDVRELEVVAVADVDPERLRSVEARYGIRRVHRDAASLLADREIDVVAVCLPPRLQVAAALAALEADKHVWIEAPVSLSLPDCDRLIAKARASGRQVTVGFHMRWHRLVRQAKEIVDRGDLGTIQTIRATWNSPRADDTLPELRRHRVLGGGALVEVASDHF